MLKLDYVLETMNVSKYALAKALGITPPALYNWNNIIPQKHHEKIEYLSEGLIKAPKQPLIPKRRKSKNI